MVLGISHPRDNPLRDPILHDISLDYLPSNREPFTPDLSSFLKNVQHRLAQLLLVFILNSLHRIKKPNLIVKISKHIINTVFVRLIQYHSPSRVGVFVNREDHRSALGKDTLVLWIDLDNNWANINNQSFDHLYGNHLVATYLFLQGYVINYPWRN